MPMRNPASFLGNEFRMKVVEYAPEHAHRLSLALRKADGGRLLCSDSFLRHYYLGHRSSRLQLLLADDGDVLATLGLGKIPIRAGDRVYEVTFGTNTYSLKPGAFSFLLLHWMKTFELGVLMPGTANLNAMLAKQPRWLPIPGLKTYWLNWDYPTRIGDPTWKKFSKPLARLLTRINPATFTERIAREEKGIGLAVEEANVFTEDMIKRSGTFTLRLDPGMEYLNWRFCTALDYSRYRIFRILKRDVTRGYLVLGDWPNCLVVSHCDGDDPEELGLGILLAISSANRGTNRYRRVLLTSMHSVMSLLFQRFGFRAKKSDTPFYMAAFGDNPIPFKVDANWLVNMGWGDSDLIVGS